MMIPPKMDREEFAERKRIGAEYLSRIARASGEKRKELMVEWAEKLYDAHAPRRMGLLKSLAGLPQLLADLRLFYSATVIPLIAEAHPDDSESEAIRLSIAGRESDCSAKIALRFPAGAAPQENSGREDPIAVKRRALVDAHIDEVFRLTKKRISRSDIWKEAGYTGATEFERWQRNDLLTSKKANRLFTRILTKKP
jgi:hypothetical protein